MKRFALIALTTLSFFTLSLCAQQPEKPVVVMDTSMGKITVELWPDKAPATVKNFLTYVDDKFYDGTIFHRVIPTFMIQGGGMLPGLKEKKTNAPVRNEAGNGAKNDKGTIAMARTNDPDSATAQFFINVKDNDALNRSPGSAGYAVFGKVIDGMDTVEKIKVARTRPSQGHEDVPVEDVVIRSIRRADKK